MTICLPVKTMFYEGTIWQLMSSVFFQSPIEKCFVGGRHNFRWNLVKVGLCSALIAGSVPYRTKLAVTWGFGFSQFHLKDNLFYYPNLIILNGYQGLTFPSILPGYIYVCIIGKKIYWKCLKKLKKENYLINLIGKYAFLLGVCWEVFR